MVTDTENFIWWEWYWHEHDNNNTAVDWLFPMGNTAQYFSYVITLMPLPSLLLPPLFYRWGKEIISNRVTCSGCTAIKSWSWDLNLGNCNFKAGVSPSLSVAPPHLPFVLWSSLSWHPMSFAIPVQEASPRRLLSTTSWLANDSPCEYQGDSKEEEGACVRVRCSLS